MGRKFREVPCAGCGATKLVSSKRFVPGKAVYCTQACWSSFAIRTGRFKGENNPRWLGGVSKDNMRYRRRAKAKFPEKEAARLKVLDAVRSGKLVREPCVRCGDPKVEGHHRDYTKPREVVWLCRHCHTQEHRRAA